MKSMDLRVVALKARKRLKNAEQINAKKQDAKKLENKREEIVSRCQNTYISNCTICQIDDKNKAFENKVRGALKNRPDNPCILNDLVDDTFLQMDSSDQKLRYMLELAERYGEVKKQIYNAREM